jgi:hypothetical protein
MTTKPFGGAQAAPVLQPAREQCVSREGAFPVPRGQPDAGVRPGLGLSLRQPRNIGSRVDIDFHLAFVADLKAAIRESMAKHPFSECVDPSADAHTGVLANFFGTIASEATDALRPKYGQLYGFEDATPPNAGMAAWTIFEYR